MNIKVNTTDIICAYIKFEHMLRAEEVDCMDGLENIEGWRQKLQLIHFQNIRVMNDLRKMAEYAENTQFNYVVVDIDEFKILEMYL